MMNRSICHLPFGRTAMNVLKITQTSSAHATDVRDIDLQAGRIQRLRAEAHARYALHPVQANAKEASEVKVKAKRVGKHLVLEVEVLIHFEN